MPLRSGGGRLGRSGRWTETGAPLSTVAAQGITGRLVLASALVTPAAAVGGRRHTGVRLSLHARGRAAVGGRAGRCRSGRRRHGSTPGSARRGRRGRVAVVGSRL